MKLVVPCRFEFDLLEKLDQINGEYHSVHEVYGAIPESVIGHGRSGSGMKLYGNVDMSHVKEFTSRAHSMGIEVNYLLNAFCLGNSEFTEDGRAEIMKYLESINNANVDSVTLSAPILADIIKRNFPDLKVCISVMAEANNSHRVALWEKMGVDRVILDYDSNRDFMRLKSVSQTAKVPLELLVNDGCLFYCPWMKYHRTLSSHGSKTGTTRKDYVDYCLLKCTIEKLDRSGEILRGPWIRPEDTKFYEDRFGIEFFKLSGRYRPTEWILNAVKAYSRRSYDGNLMDLLSLTFPSLAPHRVIVPILGGNGQTEATPPDVYIDNRNLGGFFEHIVKKGGCGNGSQCELCGYCDREATKLVKVMNPANLRDYDQSVRSSLDRLLASPIETSDVRTPSAGA